MNLKAARVSTNEVFEQTLVSFEDVPHQSPLFLDFLKDSAALDKFYPEKKTAIEEYSDKVLKNYRIDRNELGDVLTEINQTFGAGEETFKNIELLRGENCAAVVTGQQAGLFSGAIYTIYKALSAVKLAENLKKRNIEVVPIFWIAEEDHDFAEISRTFILDKTGTLCAAENTPRELAENSPVGSVKLDETMNKTLEDLFENLPHTEFTGEIKILLAETYRSGETFSTAFAKLITKIFNRFGVIVVTPMHPRLKRLCAPIFAEAVEKSELIVSGLLEKNVELQKENYQPQVLVEKDSFPFFYQNENGQRQSLRKKLENGNVKVQKSKTEFKIAELMEIARRSPQNLSPNALLRPVVQDYLLPTICYFGGAAEIAYFAQNSAIYKILNRPVTPIRHRASLTIINRKNARTLEKYRLNFARLFDGKDRLQSNIVEKFLNQETARVFSEVETNIEAALDSLRENLSESEPTLEANLENRRKKILWHIGALRKKYHRAEILKNRVVEKRLDDLFAALLPQNALQERSLNVITFLNLYGANFIEWIYEAVEPDEKAHQILSL